MSRSRQSEKTERQYTERFGAPPHKNDRHRRPANRFRPGIGLRSWASLPISRRDMAFATLGSVCIPVLGVLAVLAAGVAGWVLRGRRLARGGVAELVPTVATSLSAVAPVEVAQTIAVRAEAEGTSPEVAAAEVSTPTEVALAGASMSTEAALAGASMPTEAAFTGASINDLLAAAAEQADELICVVRPDGSIAHANVAFCRALGYDLDTLRHLKSMDVLAEQSRESISEISSAVLTDGVWRGTLVRQRQDGTTFITSASVLALTDAGGAVAHFVGVERDITQESHLREQLIHSERLAAVGQLVSGVAHELNNPLQAVIGFTELLMEGERRKESRADLERVRAEAHRAAKIVRNLLAFVRRSSAERAPAYVNDLVRATVALRRYEFSMTGLILEEEYAEDLPPVIVSREEIQQVLLNLVLNAEQAMKTTGNPARLRLRTGVSGDMVAIDVADNGPGVPSTVARRIFEPFYSTKGVGEGTGLGLSIALGIAEAHGGSLTLVPDGGIDGGAGFRLCLPAAVVSDNTGLQSAAGPTASWTAIPGRRALVADDEEALRKLLHRLLTRRGFAVDVAEDGVQAANLIEANRYDVILCDVQMPRMTGTQLFESLRRRLPHLAAAFVLISGDILNGRLQAFVEAAQIPLLSKPFGARNLDLVLEQVLANRMLLIGERVPQQEARAS